MNSTQILFKPLTQHGALRSFNTRAANVSAMLRHKRPGLRFRKPPSDALLLYVGKSNA